MTKAEASKILGYNVRGIPYSLEEYAYVIVSGPLAISDGERAFLDLIGSEGVRCGERLFALALAERRQPLRRRS